LRVMGIDFGEVRIGLAISDPDGKIALPLTTIERVSDFQAIERIHQLAEREMVDRIVIGEPRNVDGSRGQAARRVQSFRRKLMAETMRF
jgi:putative Holliday junction resolvase